MTVVIDKEGQELIVGRRASLAMSDYALDVDISGISRGGPRTMIVSTRSRSGLRQPRSVIVDEAPSGEFVADRLRLRSDCQPEKGGEG